MPNASRKLSAACSWTSCAPLAAATKSSAPAPVVSAPSAARARAAANDRYSSFPVRALDRSAQMATVRHPPLSAGPCFSMTETEVQRQKEIQQAEELFLGGPEVLGFA